MINLTLVVWNICQMAKKQTKTENGIKLNLVKYHFCYLNKSNIINYFPINVNLNC